MSITCIERQSPGIYYQRGRLTRNIFSKGKASSKYLKIYWLYGTCQGIRIGRGKILCYMTKHTTISCDLVTVVIQVPWYSEAV